MRALTRRLAPAVLTGLLSVGMAIPTHAAELSASPIDHLGRPAPHILQQMEGFASQKWVPEDTRNIILAIVAFYRGDGKGGVALPEGAPVFNQFVWPTVSANCIGGELASTGTAIAVPGPAELPLPGAAPGQTAFLFTALGTSPAAKEQPGMFVHWLNVNTLKFGATKLENTGINPQGPATVSGVADTGHGHIIAWLDGSVALADEQGNTTNSCNFAPTATSFFVS
ncbi:hypothetical protein HW450_02715 [Corynebacterium hindlerae]|uniref:Secreted protein n=2 Tax=Corynebacterium hindlerae TaxID=699041 RepID=A0A7G5FGC9_9CORY|nr:hypothetical protein [Corynebacterium hindlerae]QMV85670.1 hypothetical protein HW450_02715 [Corynebacterium hindlerae]QTH60666.1 hypothetical protein J5O04_06085 [Corynebacterium hindlerae]